MKDVIKQLKDIAYMDKKGTLPRLNSLGGKLLFLPISVIIWAIMVVFYCVVCGVLWLPFFGMGIILSVFVKDEGMNDAAYMPYVLIATCPFIWWYRYFKFGEYGNVI